jgi:hypothetical protein
MKENFFLWPLNFAGYMWEKSSLLQSSGNTLIGLNRYAVGGGAAVASV